MRTHPALILTAAVLIAPAALAAPANLVPGASGVAVPLYSAGGTTPTVTVLGSTGIQSDTLNGMTVQFEEDAVSTSLNPNAVSFAFAITASNNPSALSAALTGYGGFTTQVESCDPFTLGASGVCGTMTGTAARSSGSGAALTFSGIGTSAVSVPVIGTVYASNVYAVFTNAPSFTDPAVTVVDDGTDFTFSGLGPAAAASVPEPSTAALGVLAFAALGLAQRGRRRRA